MLKLKFAFLRNKNNLLVSCKLIIYHLIIYYFHRYLGFFLLYFISFTKMCTKREINKQWQYNSSVLSYYSLGAVYTQSLQLLQKHIDHLCYDVKPFLINNMQHHKSMQKP